MRRNTRRARSREGGRGRQLNIIKTNNPQSQHTCDDDDDDSNDDGTQQFIHDTDNDDTDEQRNDILSDTQTRVFFSRKVHNVVNEKVATKFN